MHKDRTVDDLPNLFVPGAGKSGTSSLHLFLHQHPDIYMSSPKELHFFSDDSRYPHELADYRQFFTAGAGTSYRGESSTTYMFFPDVAERIGTTIPDPRFIFVLRNPIDRVWSHYRWLKAAGSEQRPLRDAFFADLHDIPSFEANVDGNFFFYASESRYGTNLRHFYDRFGADRILVITTEQMRDDPNAALRRCTEFLVLPPMEVEHAIDENRTPSDRWRRTRQLVTDLTDPTPEAASAAGSDRRERVVGPVRSAVRRIPSLERGARRVALKLDASGHSKLPAGDREWLRSFYVDEVAEARALTGQSLAQWERDFPLSGARSGS